MDESQRKIVRDRRGELLTLINGWDPAGLLEAGAPRDEYDCLIDELFGELSRGASREELAQFLDREIREHFGVAPKDSAQFATKAMTWYTLPS